MESCHVALYSVVSSALGLIILNIMLLISRDIKLCLSPPTGGRHIVFGSVVVVCIVVIGICVISCEHDNFWGVLNFIFKLEPYIDRIKISDEFENSDGFKNWWPWPWPFFEFCAIPCECINFWTVGIFAFELELCIDYLKIFVYSENLWPWPWPSRSKWPKNLENFCFKLLNWPIWNSAFTLKWLLII